MTRLHRRRSRGRRAEWVLETVWALRRLGKWSQPVIQMARYIGKELTIVRGADNWWGNRL